jgi:hypothetical protein
MEFGLIAGPFIMLLMGLIDLGYHGYIDTMSKSKLHEISRKASTGSMSEAEIKAAVQDGMDPILLEDATVTVNVKSYFSFSNIGRPESLTVDNNGNGEFDPGDCYIDTNNNDEFDTDYGQTGTGGPDDIVIYEIIVESPRMFPLPQLYGGKDKMTNTNQTAVRNQPYGAQAQLVNTCESDL